MKSLSYYAVSILSAACLIMATTLCACSDVDIPSSPSESVATVSALSYVQDGRNVVLTWQLPTSGTISAVRLVSDNSDEVELGATTTTYTVKNPTSGTEHTYTVKVVYTDGIVSEGQTVFVTVESVEARVGYLIAENSVSEIEDDDERAAATWFQTHYASNGDILTPADLSSLDPANYSMLWIQIDRVGIGQGWQNLPAALVSDDAIASLTNYVKDGGNLLLTKHATQLLVPIGRIDSAYTPNSFSDGEGGEGDDIWTINAILGPSMDHTYDRRSHSIFSGLTTSDQYEWETYPMEGPGWREDHNCMWDCNAFGFSGEPDVVYNFEETTTSTVLAVWGHVADFCVAGIVEFTPTGDYAGRIIANGMSAYEWNQNSGTNPYQSNLETLTANCINYLK